MAVNHLCQNQRNITQPGSAGGMLRKWNAWGTGRLILLPLWRQASIYWCYSLIWFTWLLSRPVLPVGKVSCVWWMLLSEMPRSICDAAAQKKIKNVEDFLISEVLPLYHRLCNLTLLPSVITFRGRTTAGCMLMGWRWSLKRVMVRQWRPVSLMTECRSITSTET